MATIVLFSEFISKTSPPEPLTLNSSSGMVMNPPNLQQQPQVYIFDFYVMTPLPLSIMSQSLLQNIKEVAQW